MSHTKNNIICVKDLSLKELSTVLDQMVDRCDTLKELNVAFLLSIAAEEMRGAAGLPEIEPPSLYQADTPTGETFDASGEFEL